MRKCISCALLITLKLLLLTGCLPVEESALPVPTLNIPEPVIFETYPVGRGDVVLHQIVSSRLVPAREESLSFPMNGILLDSVHFNVGDAVTEGDIIIELERESLLNRLEEVSRDLELAEFDLRQVERMRAASARRAEALGISANLISYNRQRDYLRSKVEIINIQIENIEFELERRVLRASMDGYITFLHSFNEGDVSIADRQMVIIADAAETIFMVRDAAADFFTVGDEVELFVRPDTHFGIVIDPLEHNITANRREHEAYILIPDGHLYGFTTTSSGTIRVILGESEDVLYVPTDALNTVGDRVFVFVLEDGLRTLRDIRVGVVGNTMTEVISGLELGELVIIN